jgi:transglutaminase-like putative cysteine protease
MLVLRFTLASVLAGMLISTPSNAAQKGNATKQEDKASSTTSVRPDFGPRPAWAEEVKTPLGDPKHQDDPFQFLLSNAQERLTATGVENYVEYVVQPLNQAGLQGLGNVTIPWNVDRTNLTLNGVSIERDGKTIDALKRDDITILQRETKLEQSMFTGIRTLVMPVRGLQVGDKLRVAYTYKTKPGSVGKTEEVQDLNTPIPVGYVVRRMVVSKDLPVRWSVPTEFKATLRDNPTTLERTFVAEKVEPSKARSFLPDRFKHKLVQVSAFKSWDEVASGVAPKFDTARKTTANSAVSLLADKIAADQKDPHDRMLAALRSAQDDVRYVAILLGDGDYTPMSAEDVWAQRYGDCKGKTAFILALLDRLGIQAEPVLASITYDDLLEKQLPSLAMLDHVYVRAHIGTEIYYLDGTKFGQRTLEELKEPTTLHILPLIEKSDLITVPDTMPSGPLIESNIVWDARNGVLQKVPFEATLILRGVSAADARAEAATSSDREKLTEKWKDKVPAIRNDDLQYVSTEAEAPDGSYRIKFKGAVELDWTPVEGMKGNRFQFSQTTLKWDGEFDRDDDAGKDIPVLMTFPYWERTVEKIVLPNGGKDFALDAPTIDQTIAATRFTRTIQSANGVITATSDFKRLGRELDGNSARTAKSALKDMSENYAYLVSRKKLKLAK